LLDIEDRKVKLETDYKVKLDAEVAAEETKRSTPTGISGTADGATVKAYTDAKLLSDPKLALTTTAYDNLNLGIVDRNTKLLAWRGKQKDADVQNAVVLAASLVKSKADTAKADQDALVKTTATKGKY